jgi:uncharacterized lipoprotein YddW (UPF0748 family)
MNKFSLLLSIALILLTSFGLSTYAVSNNQTMKGMWFTGIDYTRLDNESKIKSELSRLESLGFSHVYVNVNPGCTTFNVMINNQNLKCTAKPYKNRDILKEFINNTSMKVIAWNEYGYLTPSSHPIITLDPKAILRTSTGSIADDKGHFWLDPFNVNVITMQKLINSELIRQYPSIGGIQYDDHFGFSSMMIPASLNRDYRGPKSKFDESWMSYRASKFTNIVSDLLTFTKNLKPTLQISISPGDIDQSYKYYLQDIPTWINLRYGSNKLIDNVIIQIYRERISNFKEVIQRSKTQKVLNSNTPIYVGISYIANGSYLTNSLISEQYQLAKRSGFKGVSLFHNLGFQYDSENKTTNAKRDQMMRNL